jgi:hypothetical protein
VRVDHFPHRGLARLGFPLGQLGRQLLVELGQGCFSLGQLLGVLSVQLGFALGDRSLIFF